MITDLADVSGEARKDQVAFLRKSPVAYVADWLEAGTHVLKTGTIKSNEFLGDQVTIFGNLDDAWAKKEVGSEKFLVKHVRNVLLNPKCTDSKSRERLKSIEQALSDRAMTPNITVLRGQPDMIIDGNKTAAAFNHLHQADDKIDLKVFVVVAK